MSERTYYRKLGQAIATTRKMHGLTQPDIAKLLGITFQQVQKYESGKDRISAYKLIKLAAVFEVEIGELVGWGL